MDNQQPQAKTRKSEDIVRAEPERKSRDLYKIFNPTNQDFEVMLNVKISPEVWTVPAKEGERYGELTVPMYVAEKYFEEMSQKIITAKSDRAVIDENDKREAKGLDKMDLHTAQPRFENRNLLGLTSKRDQIVKILNGGLVKEYGLGSQAPQQVDRREKVAQFDPGDVLGEVRPASQRGEPPVTPLKEESTPKAPTMPLNQTVEAIKDDAFTCDVCGKVVSTPLALAGHKRSHKPEVVTEPVANEVKVVVEEDD